LKIPIERLQIVPHVLDAAIGTPDRVLPLSERTPPPGTTVMAGGYAHENPNMLTVDRSC